jgi:hypothetical protein
VTETGVKCGPKAYQVGWWIFKSWKSVTQQQQLDWFRRAAVAWREPTCDGLDWYQHQSGPGVVTDYGLNDGNGNPRLAWDGFKA